MRLLQDLALRDWVCVVALGAALALSGCDTSMEAPINAGYCWRIAMDADGKPQFTPITADVHNLETCAAHLEAVSMREKKPELAGAYQGQFIFITPKMVQSSMHLKGVRYRLFDAVIRAKIDRDIQWKLDDEKHPSQFGPQAPPESGAK